MRKSAVVLFCLLMVVIACATAEAITVTATPSPATVNQVVTISVTASYSTGGTCDILVNFGDGSPEVNIGTCVASCTLTTTHIYTTPGTYTITARSNPSCGITAPPDPASTSLLVQCVALTMATPSNLPSGVVGQSYSYSIQASGGYPPITYSVTAGSLPPGLSMNSSGVISGTPTTAGNYSFTVRARDSCPVGVQSVSRVFSLTISSVGLSVNASPSSFSIPRGIASTKTITYSVSTTAGTNTTAYSNRGEFIGGGQVLGQINTRLSVSVRNGRGTASETITILPAVIKRAENLGVTRIRYRRTFSIGTETATASVAISITTEAGAELQITRLRLYFDNGRAEITVKRNQPSLKAYAELTFVGSGLFRAYWEVDGRRLGYVYKHLVYGRSVTFETPDIPPLPTFDPGTHKLKLVILEPQQDIPEPSAIYFVTSEEYVGPLSVSLLSPEDGAELPYAPFVFEWEPSEKAALYLVEFFKEKTGKEQVFSAYTRQNAYRVTEQVLDFFPKSETYLWRVKVYDKQMKIIGQSKAWRFRLLGKQAVPLDR